MSTFSIVFVGHAFSLFGSRLVQFTLVWWLTMRSGSASVLAFASIMAILPQVVLGPLAGTLVDRWNRRRVLMMSDSVIAVAVGVLALLYQQGSVQVWHLYAVMLVRSLGGAFQWPTMQASTSLMVPPSHLSRVSGLTQSLLGMANIFAPPWARCCWKCCRFKASWLSTSGPRSSRWGRSSSSRSPSPLTVVSRLPDVRSLRSFGKARVTCGGGPVC